CAAGGHNDIRRECGYFRQVSANVLRLARRPTSLYPYVAAIGPAQLLQALHKRHHASLPFGILRGHEHDDAPHPLTRLRPRRKRPRHRRGAEQRDELATSHSMTSSAMASTPGGTVRPSAFAVFKLSTRSNLVGCKTGRSAGFAPLRIRPA